MTPDPEDVIEEASKWRKLVEKVIGMANKGPIGLMGAGVSALYLAYQTNSWGLGAAGAGIAMFGFVWMLYNKTKAKDE